GGLDPLLVPHRPLAVALPGDVVAALRHLAVRVVLHVLAVELAVLVLGALEDLAARALLDARLGVRRSRDEQQRQGPLHGASTPFSTSSAPTRTGLPSRLDRSLWVTDTLGAKAAAWKASRIAVVSSPFLPPPQASCVPRSSVRQASSSRASTRNGAPST